MIFAFDSNNRGKEGVPESNICSLATSGTTYFTKYDQKIFCRDINDVVSTYCCRECKYKVQGVKV